MIALVTVQALGGVFGVDPHLKSSVNEQLFRWQWRRARTFEAARRMLIEAISGKRTAGGACFSVHHVRFASFVVRRDQWK
jgi:hypothetical protein